MSWQDILKRRYSAKTNPENTSIDILMKDYMDNPDDIKAYRKLAMVPKTRNNEWTNRQMNTLIKFADSLPTSMIYPKHLINRLHEIIRLREGRPTKEENRASDEYVDKL
tara:strand:+ start:200 stop:526 length:327 start_codon:yes stop_codon:yes gene_type:complete